jgi:membrane protease YdiL (CAAX protease family)
MYEPDTLVLAETVLNRMGLPARIAMGGVFEETVFRWAVLGLIAWAGLRMTGGVGPAVQWVAIVVAALLFGLSHLPGASTAGVQLSSALLAAAVAMNACMGIVAGWLAWHRGLVAAMTAHATVHVVWFVVERVRLL